MYALLLLNPNVAGTAYNVIVCIYESVHLGNNNKCKFTTKWQLENSQQPQRQQYHTHTYTHTFINMCVTTKTVTTTFNIFSGSLATAQPILLHSCSYHCDSCRRMATSCLRYICLCAQAYSLSKLKLLYAAPTLFVDFRCCSCAYITRAVVFEQLSLSPPSSPSSALLKRAFACEISNFNIRSARAYVFALISWFVIVPQG